MFPYPEHFKYAAPPVATSIMVVWALLSQLVLPPGSLIGLVPLFFLFPGIIVIHILLIWDAQGMKRLDQCFYSLIHGPLAFVVWTFTIMHVGGNGFS